MLLATIFQAATVYLSFGAPPPLVQVQPGVQVVPDIQEEVYFVDGAYWHRVGGSWYRSYDYRGNWQPVQVSYVPRPIVMQRHHHWHHEGPRPVVYHHYPRQRYAPPRQVVYAPPRHHGGHHHHDRGHHRGHR